MNVNVLSCIERYAEIGQAMGLADNDSAEMLARSTIVAFRKLSSHCGIPSSLQELKIPESPIPGMAEAAVEIQRLLDSNPREMTLADAVAIYKAAYKAISIVDKDRIK